MTIEVRIERLQQELAAAKQHNRRQMLALLAIAAALATAWLVTESTRPAYAQAAERPQGIIRAHGFVLVDDEGRERGQIGMTARGPVLRLLDEKGKPRAALAASNELGPFLSLYDENGQPRAGLATTPFGPGLVLVDEKGNQRASIGASVTQTPDGRKITLPESSILLYGPDGKVIWQAPR